MDHTANLARVQALRDDLDTYLVGLFCRRSLEASLVHIEDVLTRHAPVTMRLDSSRRCIDHVVLRFPCPDYTSALTLLDALDGGGK